MLVRIAGGEGVQVRVAVLLGHQHPLGADNPGECFQSVLEVRLGDARRPYR
jgi:hypothetical protein